MFSFLSHEIRLCQPKLVLSINEVTFFPLSKGRWKKRRAKERGEDKCWDFNEGCIKGEAAWGNIKLLANPSNKMLEEKGKKLEKERKRKSIMVSEGKICEHDLVTSIIKVHLSLHWKKLVWILSIIEG